MYSSILLCFPVAQGAGVVQLRNVTVDLKECMKCGVQAWASDNWRTTGMMNFNNNLLVDIRILVDTRALYMEGLPIQAIFETLFDPLLDEHLWSKEYPALAVR